MELKIASPMVSFSNVCYGSETHKKAYSQHFIYCLQLVKINIPKLWPRMVRLTLLSDLAFKAKHKLSYDHVSNNYVPSNHPSHHHSQSDHRFWRKTELCCTQSYFSQVCFLTPQIKSCFKMSLV